MDRHWWTDVAEVQGTVRHNRGMADARKGNDKYVLGKDVLGRSAWLLRDPHQDSGSTKAGSAANLLGVADQGVSDPHEDLPSLPKPSPELTERLLLFNDWLGLDLSGLDLRDVLAECKVFNLSDTNLSGADLRGGRLFGGAIHQNTNMTGARTAGMTLEEGVRFEGLITDGTFDMTDMLIGQSEIRFAERTRLIGYAGVTPSHYGGYGQSVRFHNVDFSGEHFKYNDLAAFSEISNGDFTNTTFTGIHGRGYVLRGHFVHCDFTDAEMRDAEMSLVYFERCDLSDADLSGWTFEGHNTFHTCNFKGANLSGWMLQREVGWSSLGIVGTNNLSDADLTGADEKVLQELKRTGHDYRRFSVANAASNAGVSIDELGMLLWLGEVEARNNVTCEVVTDRVSADVHIPEWSLRKLSS